MAMLRAQHAENLEQYKRIISSNKQKMQTLESTSAEKIQSLQRDVANLKKFKDSIQAQDETLKGAGAKKGAEQSEE